MCPAVKYRQALSVLLSQLNHSKRHSTCGFKLNKINPVLKKVKVFFFLFHWVKRSRFQPRATRRARVTGTGMWYYIHLHTHTLSCTSQRSLFISAVPLSVQPSCSMRPDVTKTPPTIWRTIRLYTWQLLWPTH